MRVIRPAIAIAFGLIALAGCSTLGKIGSMMGSSDSNESKEPQEGRISILSYDQKLTPDPALAARGVNMPPMAAFPNWTQPGGTPQNAPPNIEGGQDLKVVWRKGAGKGSSRDERIVASPIVVDGKIYVLDARQSVRAYDANSGSHLWTHALRGKLKDKRAVGGGIAAADGRIYAVSGFGVAVALDAATGDEIWRTKANAPFHAAPTVAGGQIYAVTNDSELLAMDAKDGAVQWTHQAIAEPARILAASSSAVDGDTVVAPFASGEVVALLAANGRRLWVDALSRSGRLTSLSSINDVAGRPVASEGIIYAVSHSGVLAAIDERSGQRIWAKGVASVQTPWLAGDAVYVVSVDGELVAVDKATGGVFWVTQLKRFTKEKKKKGRIAWAGPIMVGGRLILVSSQGQLLQVAPENGEVKRTVKIGQPVFVPPIAANGTVYLYTNKGDLVALR